MMKTLFSFLKAVSLDECLRLYTNEDIIDGWYGDARSWVLYHMK